MSGLNKISELNGLRGFAILIVLVYHFVNISVQLNGPIINAVNNFFLMGWVGVDIFFALSGFLITSILLKTKSSETYFKSFYIKRLLRIFPLYYLYLAFMFFFFLPHFAPHLNPAEQLNIKTTENSQLYFWLYLSNIKQFFQNIFFGSALGHLWSLSIEEQFYLIWPLIIYYCDYNQLKRILLAVFVGSIILRAFFYYHNVPGLSIYSFTFTRLDALGYGAYISVSLQKPIRIKPESVKLILKVLLILTALLFIFFGPWPNSTPVMLIIGFSLIGLTNAFLILTLQSHQPSKIKLFFNNNLLKFLGKYSYALYLFNPLVRQICFKFFLSPFMVWGSYFVWYFLFIMLCLLISIVVSIISWHAYEKWFMKIKSRYEEQQLEQLPINADGNLISNSF